MTETRIRQILLQQAKAGTLASFVGSRFGGLDGAEFDTAIAVCVDLHNAGEIDFLGLVHEPQFKALGSGTFFSAQHVYVDAIPTLASSLDAMLACVDALVAQAGSDGMARQPLVPLGAWLRADQARALELADKAEAGEQPATNYYFHGLVASADIARARKAAEKFDDQRRLAAVSALGEIHHDCEVTGLSFDLFSRLHEAHRSDDHLHAALVSASVSLAGQNPSAAETARTLCAALVEEAGPQTIYYSARAIWQQKHVRADEGLTGILLQPLLGVAAEHKGTIREIDTALSTLMRGGNQKVAIDFVTTLLGVPNCTLTLEELQVFSNALEKSEHLPATIIAWLRSAAPALCSGAVSLHSGDDLAGQVVSLPREAVEWPANEQAFICRKAVGYFFFQPVTAASILVSFLRSCDADARSEITGLLFMPLLQNYGGAPRDYLEGLDDKDPAYAAVAEALAENRRYMEGLTKGEDIRELAPSEHQRLVAHMRQRDEAAQTFKAARAQSVLRHFVKNSTILYGRSSLNYFGEAGGRRAVETELQPHSVSMELPRMLVVDPLGLEYLLWRFRNEELEA